MKEVNEKILNSGAKYILDERDCAQIDNGWSLTQRWEFPDGSIVELDGRGYTATGREATECLRSSKETQIKNLGGQ